MGANASRNVRIAGTGTALVNGHRQRPTDGPMDLEDLLTMGEYYCKYPVQAYVYTEMVDFGLLPPKVVVATLKADRYWKKQLWKPNALDDQLECAEFKHWSIIFKFLMRGGNYFWMWVDERTIENKVQFEYKIMTKEEMEPIADHVELCGIHLGHIEISVDIIYELAVKNRHNGTPYNPCSNNCQNWLLALIEDINVVLKEESQKKAYNGTGLRRPDQLKAYSELKSNAQLFIKTMAGKVSGSLPS